MPHSTHTHQTQHERAAHDEQPAAHGDHAGRDLNRLAFSATVHCLTGCVIGEVTGMFIARALGWGAVSSIALAVGLAFLFGYTLTSIPLFRAGLTFAAALPIILAVDTLSITIMEIIDNLFVYLVGGMEMGPEDPLLWLSIAAGFAIAFPFAFLANRALLRRGKGHALIHQHHH